MLSLGIFLATLGLLFFSSQLLTKALSIVLYRFTRSQKVVVTFLALLFLPGVIIHELSHLVTAGILFVRTGEIEFLPKIQEDSVKLGSVQVAKTDPFRRALIGLAPMFVGIPILLFFLSFVVSLSFTWEKSVLLQYAFGGYGVFEVGNTLFSSKKDLEGTLELGGAILLIGTVLYFAGVREPFLYLASFITPGIEQFLLSATILLIIPIGINVAIYLFSKMLERR